MSPFKLRRPTTICLRFMPAPLGTSEKAHAGHDVIVDFGNANSHEALQRTVLSWNDYPTIWFPSIRVMGSPMSEGQGNDARRIYGAGRRAILPNVQGLSLSQAFRCQGTSCTAISMNQTQPPPKRLKPHVHLRSHHHFPDKHTLTSNVHQSLSICTFDGFFSVGFSCLSGTVTAIKFFCSAFWELFNLRRTDRGLPIHRHYLPRSWIQRWCNGMSRGRGGKSYLYSI